MDGSEQSSAHAPGRNRNIVDAVQCAVHTVRCASRTYWDHGLRAYDDDDGPRAIMPEHIYTPALHT